LARFYWLACSAFRVSDRSLGLAKVFIFLLLQMRQIIFLDFPAKITCQAPKPLNPLRINDIRVAF
jgi:hypothetical protein